MTKQIAVKLPYGLVSEIDRLVEAGTFTSRSQAIRSGLETMVAVQRREVIDRRYRDAAARCPETQDEIAEVTDLAIKAIHEEPWEPWW
ncbi:MAG: ribbon-helix-helix domain-containing protein [Solirubrobacteraceae bacterium]